MTDSSTQEWNVEDIELDLELFMDILWYNLVDLDKPDFSVIIPSRDSYLKVFRHLVSEIGTPGNTLSRYHLRYFIHGKTRSIRVVPSSIFFSDPFMVGEVEALLMPIKGQNKERDEQNWLKLMKEVSHVEIEGLPDEGSAL